MMSNGLIRLVLEKKWSFQKNVTSDSKVKLSNKSQTILDDRNKRSTTDNRQLNESYSRLKKYLPWNIRIISSRLQISIPVFSFFWKRSQIFSGFDYYFFIHNFDTEIIDNDARW